MVIRACHAYLCLLVVVGALIVAVGVWLHLLPLVHAKVLHQERGSLLGQLQEVVDFRPGGGQRPMIADGKDPITGGQLVVVAPVHLDDRGSG